MILDIMSNALEKELAKYIWVGIVLKIIGIIIIIFLIICAIECYISIIRTGKYTQKIYELLEDSPLNKNYNKKDE